MNPNTATISGRRVANDGLLSGAGAGIRPRTGCYSVGSNRVDLTAGETYAKLPPCLTWTSIKDLLAEIQRGH